MSVRHKQFSWKYLFYQAAKISVALGLFFGACLVSPNINHAFAATETKISTEIAHPETTIISETIETSDPIIFGAQILKGQARGSASKAAEAGIRWTRYGEPQWKEIEPVPPSETADGVVHHYDWSSLENLYIPEVRALVDNGISPMIVTVLTPEWAQKYPGNACGPIADHALDDFGEFMFQMVTKFKEAGYTGFYWELGNEPDVSYRIVGGNSGFGCWGEAGETNFGGEAFAEMFIAAYGRIKEADPTARVMLGGLLINCDYADIPAGAATCPESKFLEGVLQRMVREGGIYFDAIAYHAYTSQFRFPAFLSHDDWNLGLTESVALDWDRIHRDWRNLDLTKDRRGIFVGKTAVVREILRKYNANGIELLMNEGALHCNPYFSTMANFPSNPNFVTCPPDGFPNPETNPAYSQYFEDMANYVVRLYARTAFLNDPAVFPVESASRPVIGTIWYTFNRGWRQGGILSGSGQELPAYKTFKYLNGFMKGSQYNRQFFDGNCGLESSSAGPDWEERLRDLHATHPNRDCREGYEFVKDGQSIQIYWSNDSRYSYGVTLPANAKVLNKYGVVQPQSRDQTRTVRIGFEPVFVVTAPVAVQENTAVPEVVSKPTVVHPPSVVAPNVEVPVVEAPAERAPTLTTNISLPVNIRRGPGLSYQIMDQAHPNDSFVLVGEDAAGQWRQIEVVGELGWIYAPLTQVRGSVSTAPVDTTSGTENTAVTLSTTTSIRVNIRQGPGLNHAILGKAYPKDSFSVIGKDESGSWWQIELLDGSYGWIYATLTRVSGNAASIPTIAN